MAAALDFTGYIAERTQGFTGRVWVLTAIGDWLADRKGPTFFIITGEPGVGKSALAGRLTQVRPVAAHHFCIARRSDTIDPVVFARSLSLQLCRIDGFAQNILQSGNITISSTQNIQTNYGQAIGVQVHNLVVNAPSASSAFTHAVLEPLRALYPERTEEFEGQLLLLIDGLDEAVQHTGAETIVDLLANAGALPHQVRVVLTSRSEGAVLRHFQERQIPHFQLDAGQAENLADLREYTQAQVEASTALHSRLVQQKMSTEAFVDRVTAASQGNFLYLVRLLPAIAAGTQRFDTLEALPQGLAGIYREFLSTRSIGANKQSWRTCYRPILGVLTVAQNPLTSAQIAQFTGLSDQALDDSLQDLRQFFDPASADGNQYTLYHQSVSDWLQDKARSEEFWVDGVTVHRQIVDYYWGDSPQWLEAKWASMDEYGMQFTVAHLLGAQRYAELVQLVIQSPSWHKARFAQEGSDAGYLNDLERVWAWAEREDSWHVGRQLRCALLWSTIRSRVGNLHPDLLARLVQFGVWKNAAGALAHITHMQNETQRASALLAIAPLLPESFELKEQLYVAATRFTYKHIWAELLGKLVAYLPDPLQDRALTAIGGCDNSYISTVALLEAIPYMADHLIDKAIAIANPHSSPEWPDTVSLLAPRLANDAQKARLLAKTKLILDSTNRDDWGMWALGILLPYLPDDLRDEALAAASAVREKAESRWEYSEQSADRLDFQVTYLVICIPFLSAEEHVVALTELRKIFHNYPQAGTLLRKLVDLLPYLTEEIQIEFISEILTAKDGGLNAIRVQRLHKLAEHTPESLKAAVLATMITLVDGFSDNTRVRNRNCLLQGLLPHLFSTLQASTVTEILTTLENCRDQYTRIYILSDLLTYLPAEMADEKSRIMQMAQDTLDEKWWGYGYEERVQAWCRWSQHLPEKEGIAKLEELWSNALSIRDENARVFVLCKLAPHLPPTTKEPGCEEALDSLADIPDIGSGDTFVEALDELVPSLPDQLKLQAAQMAAEIQSTNARTEAMIGMLPFLPAALQDWSVWRSTREVKAMDDPIRKVGALAQLTLNLPDPMKFQALSELLTLDVHGVPHKRAQVQTLTKLLPPLPDRVKLQALEHLLGVEDRLTRTKAMGILGAYLTDAWKESAWQLICQAKTNQSRVERRRGMVQGVLGKLKQWITSSQLTETPPEPTALASNLHDSSTALPELFPLQEEFATAQGNEHELEQIGWISGLSAYLPTSAKPKIVQEGLAKIQQIIAEVKAKIPPLISPTGPYLFEILFGNRMACVDRLIEIDAFLPNAFSAQLWQNAFTLEEWQTLIKWAAEPDEDRLERFKRLLGVIPILPEAVKCEALYHLLRALPFQEEVRSFLEEFDRLAQYIADTLTAQELQNIIETSLQSETSTMGQATEQQPYQNDTLEYELHSVLQHKGVYAQIALMSGLAIYLPQASKFLVLREALHSAIRAETDARNWETLPDRRIIFFKKIIHLWQPANFAGIGDDQASQRALWREWLRILAQRRRPQFLHDLGTLAPLIAHVGGTEAIDETFTAIKDVTRWWP